MTHTWKLVSKCLEDDRHVELTLTYTCSACGAWGSRFESTSVVVSDFDTCEEKVLSDVHES